MNAIEMCAREVFVFKFNRLLTEKTSEIGITLPEQEKS